jgi:glycosyltransferase involved in cell wall biosynthesis
MDLSRVSVVLPCLNEALTLKSVIEQIRAISHDIEIVVVDNCSTDDSYAIALGMGVKVLKESKKGKGFAVRRGFSSINIKCEVVVLIDSDDTYSLSNLKKAIELVVENKYDMVVGTRVEEVIDSEARSKTFRAGHGVGNLVFSKISQVLHPSGVVDSLSGFRVMSRNFIESFTGGASEFEIEAELNAHAAFINTSVANIDVKYKGRPIGSESKLRTFRDGYKILRFNFRIFRTYRPKAAYSLIAVLWLLVAISLGIDPILVYFETGLVPRFPSLIAAVGALIVSVQLWNTGVILERIKVAHLSQVKSADKSLG